MGGGYSASASSSATSGNKTSIGPVTFGGTAFGAQGNGAGAGNSIMWLALAAVAGVFGWMMFKKS